MIILIILIILVLLSFNLFRNLFKSDATILDDVKLKEKEPNNNGFALMLETENADGTTSYVESNSSTWPTDMKFNSELSGCIDVNGNIIGDALEYDSTNNIMNVSVSGTAYCYVYFDIKRYCNKNETLGECLIRKNSEIDSLNDNIEGGLYRYQGTNDVVNNNYVCFGTTDKNTCINNANKYMYRIIGIDENYQIKLIKNTSIGKYMWHSNKTTDTSWPDSDLFKGLNGNDYLLNTTYVPVGWESKIATTTWKYGDEISVSKTAANLYATENGWTNTVSAKIGIWYLHDYYYASQSGGLDCSSSSNSSTCKSAWMHISNNGSSAYEWTMSRGGSDGEACYAWSVLSDGDVTFHFRVNITNAVRPVFYLTNNVEYSSGTGTSNDPFIIKE